MDKKKIGITSLIIMAIISVILIVFGGIKVANANKLDEAIELGIKYLTEGNYEEAIIAFDKAISIDGKNAKALTLNSLVKDYKAIETLYAEKDYETAAELIAKLNGNEYVSYIQGTLSDIDNKVQKKVEIIKEINLLEEKINELIKAEKYQEAIDLINKYLNLSQDLKDEYVNKLKELMSSVDNSKKEYEEKKESERIAQAEEEAKKKKDEYIMTMNSLIDPNSDSYWDRNNTLSTAEMVSFTAETYEAWDGMLNKIWATLQQVLPKDKMDKLTDEQLVWIEGKSKTEAEFMENLAGAHINFVMINCNSALAQITRDRCYELVNGQM